MPHSPLLRTVYPPIRDLEQYEIDIRQYRVEVDNGENNKYAQSELTEVAEALLDQCNFLDAKLTAKRNEVQKLSLENNALKERVKRLEQQLDSTVATENCGATGKG